MVCLVDKQSRAHEHSGTAAAATLSTARATLDSSSTCRPVVAVLVLLLRTARAAFERSSMSTFSSLLHCNKKVPGSRSLDCSSATRTRQRRARCGQAVTGTRALSSSSSSTTQRHTGATLDSSNTCRSVVAVANSSSTAFVCCCCSCSKKREKQSLFSRKYEDPGRC